MLTNNGIVYVTILASRVVFLMLFRNLQNLSVKATEHKLCVLFLSASLSNTVVDSLNL